MKTRVALSALVLGVLSLPAMAQVPPFDAEIDCGGLVSPPAQVPYTLRFENQTLQNVAMDITVRMSLPNGNVITLREAALNLRPNQDRDISQRVRLPASAPAGSYTITLTAASATFSTFDTCSFNAS
jgi:NPCBM-associated, NEW3 domain of alpha-galactosidase